MVKILIVLLAALGAYIVANGYFHLGVTGCLICAVGACILGMGLSSK